MLDDLDFWRILSDLCLKPVRLFPLFSNIFPVQTPVLNRFSQVLFTNVFRGIQISNRSGNFENPIIRTRRKPETVGEQFQYQWRTMRVSTTAEGSVLLIFLPLQLLIFNF
jgi:hypothetical protein